MRRVGRNDFVWAHAHPLIPNGDVRDRDAVSVDARLAASYAGRADDSHTIGRRPGRRWSCLAARVLGGSRRFHEFYLSTGLAASAMAKQDGAGRRKGQRLDRALISKCLVGLTEHGTGKVLAAQFWATLSVMRFAERCPYVCGNETTDPLSVGDFWGPAAKTGQRSRIYTQR